MELECAPPPTETHTQIKEALERRRGMVGGMGGLPVNKKKKLSIIK